MHLFSIMSKHSCNVVPNKIGASYNVVVPLLSQNQQTFADLQNHRRRHIVLRGAGKDSYSTFRSTHDTYARAFTPPDIVRFFQILNTTWAVCTVVLQLPKINRMTAWAGERTSDDMMESIQKFLCAIRRWYFVHARSKEVL